MTDPVLDIQDKPLSEALGERYLSYALSTIMARSLPDVRRVTIPGASHPMNRGNPDAFNAAVLDFLASCAA